MLLGATILIMISSTLIHQRHQSIDQMDELTGNIVKLLEQQERNQAAALEMALLGLSGNPELRRAFLSGDREKLLALASPVFQKLKQRHDITHFYFSDKNRINFLRVHNPGQHGDKINRYTTMQAAASGAVSKGLEFGQSGVFTLRVVLPWYDGQALIGFLEFGMEVGHIFTQIEPSVNVNLIEAYRKTALDFEVWNSTKLRDRESRWDISEKYVLSGSQSEDIPEGLGEQLNAHENGADELRNFFWAQTGVYYLSNIRLTDVAGTQVGNLIIVRDVTKDIVSFLLTNLVIISLVVFLGILTSLIFNRVARQIQKSVRSAYGQLELDVERRSKDLNAANVVSTRLDRIVEDSINEVFVFDAETLKFLQVNASACRNLGYTAEELRELTPLDLKPEFTFEQFEDAIAPLRSGEQHHFRIQTIHRRKDGSHYDVDIVLQQIKSGGQPVFAAIIEDITERKNVERELLEHRDHLQELVDAATKELKAKATELELTLAKEQELNKLQREFVSMASHEFRTPLAIIDATAQRMKSRADKNQLTPEDAVQRVEKIRAAVQRMTRLMESTLDAARMDVGMLNIEIGECDLRFVLLEVLTNQIELSPDHNISYDLQELPDGIKGDSGALEQVFSNLLSNATKYAPDAPDIEVIARAEGDQVVISVRDQGIGIDEDELDRIGERFFRARTSTGTAGTGIGLNLVKTLVEIHGGTVSVESKKGEGSAFTVRLPIAGPNQSEQADTRAA